MRNQNKTLVRKHEEKKPMARPRCRCEGNVKMDLKYIGCEVVD
jgi:hypothetical protein